MIRIVHMSLFLGLMVIFVMTLSGCSHSGTSGGSAPGGPPVGSSPSGDWTWVSGGNLINQTGVYTAPSGNVPGGRSGSVSWIDASGNFWLFGGYGIDSTGSGGWLNDLWKFDGANWTWVSGSNLINQAGVYSAPSGNVPGGGPALFPGSTRAATSGSSAGMASIRPETWEVLSSMTSGSSTAPTGPGCRAAIPAIRQAYTRPLPGTSRGGGMALFPGSTRAATSGSSAGMASTRPGASTRQG